MTDTPIVFHDTMSGASRAFAPMSGREVKMYVCGITPYDETHLGHARCYVVFDVVRRFLEHRGFKVRHIQNFTDVDDKIIERARKSNVDPLAFPKPYMLGFHEHM